MRAMEGLATVAWVLLAAVAAPGGTRTGGVDDVKAAAERLWAALNSRDLDAWAAVVHEQAVGFNLVSPFPVEGRAAMRRTFEGLFATTESFTITPLNVQYRVVGDTGIAWGHVLVAMKPKDGPARAMWGREVLTYVKVEGRWQMLAVHASAIPPGGL